jgi:hypothetical protein
VHPRWRHGWKRCVWPQVGKLNTAVARRVIKKVVHISGKILQLSVDSWRLWDYIEAVKCPEFVMCMTKTESKILNDKRALKRLEATTTAQTNSTEDMVSGDGETSDDVEWTDVIETKYFYACW